MPPEVYVLHNVKPYPIQKLRSTAIVHLPARYQKSLNLYVDHIPLLISNSNHLMLNKNLILS